ncbi:haloalkane dehalogenase [Flagellimonas meridianipacifica]|uniref:Haloalkane dehalogenase n=2 Tax=Flagellimonas meridianipacifica TaxID=1080225 RepID=A0A2T0MIM7_9FLAO|nr:haloalkane dehalogenase [Allomuricauda pacifica]
MKYLILNLFIMSTLSISAQHWVDTVLYPFQSKHVQLPSGKMHYVDEGKGDVLLFVHGTPTWSFLYRDFVKELSESYRCIAIDHLGFGLSEKPAGFEGTPQNHSENLAAFITALNLKDITLVVHDFGGSIGLGAALQQPDRIKNVVLFNSWLWSTKEDPMAQEIDGLLNSEAGQQYYLEQNYSVQVLLKQAFIDPSKLTDEVHQQYLSPFPDSESRKALLTIGKGFVGASDWYQSLWEKLDILEDKKWLILWGTKDPFLNTSYLDKWKSKLPTAKIKEFDSGHFVQEEKTAEAIVAMKRFLD